MKPTIGIEEEFIVVDKNYNPVNYKFDDFNEEYYSKEMHQGVLESKTDICFSLLQLKESLYKNRNNAIKELNKQKQFDINLFFLHDKYSNLNIWKDRLHIANNPNTLIFTEDILEKIIEVINR